MHIQCTKKLLEFIKPAITEKDTDNDLYAWHANYITNNRRKLLVVMNDISRFTLVFYGIKKRDFKKTHVWFITAMYNSMRASGFSDEDIMRYLDGMPEEFTFNKTKNRTLVARMNKALEVAEWGCQDEGVYEDILDQPHVSKFCNQYIMCENNYKVCYYPKDKLKEYIDLLS